jgi:hypothetical protein
VDLTGAVYTDGQTILGANTFDDPLRTDTSSYIASRWYVDSLIAGAGGSLTQVNAGYGLTGLGTPASALKVDTGLLATRAAVYFSIDSLALEIGATPPDGSETKIIAGTGITVTGSGTDANKYVITNTGTAGANPLNALSILNYGGVADATVSGTSVTGTNNTPALLAMLNAAADNQLCVIPNGNFLFSTVLDTIKGPKSVNLLILGNTYHNTGGNGVDWLIFSNASGPTEQHIVRHYGECFGRTTIPSNTTTTRGNGTSPVWSAFTGTPFKFYNVAQVYLEFNRIQNFKNGIEFIGHDYDSAGRGCQEITVAGRWLIGNANAITMTSLNGRSFVNQNTVRGLDGGTLRISGGLGIKIDGYSGAQYDPVSGVSEIYNGAFRNNTFEAMVESLDSIVDCHADATENIFRITVEQNIYSNNRWRFRSVSPNYARGTVFEGRGNLEATKLQDGLGINGEIRMQIWDNFNGRFYGNYARIDGDGNIVILGTKLTKFQRDNSPANFKFAPWAEYEVYKNVTASTYTPVTGDRWVAVNNASHTLTLPAASSNTGRRITIFNDHTSNALTVSNTSNNTSIPSLDNMTYISNGSIWRGESNIEGTGGGGGSSIFTADAAGYTTTHKLGVRTASVSSTSLALPASTTSVSSFKVPTGAHPTSPADGDEWRVAAARYMAYNGVTYQYLTIPDNGVAKQIVRRNSANDGYEHAYSPYTLHLSKTSTATATTTSSSGNSFIGGATTITGGLTAGDQVELNGSGTFNVGNVSGSTPSIDFVVGSQTVHVGLSSGYSNLQTGTFTYEFKATPTTTGSNVTTLIHYKVTFRNGTTGAVQTLENYTSLSALNTTTPTVNAIGYWSNTGNTMTGYSATVEVKRL